MISREALESRHDGLEQERTGEVERRIEKCASGGHHTFGDGDAMKRGSRVNPQAHGHVDGVASLQPPPRKVESLLDGLRGFTRAADEKYPERSDAVTLDPLGDFTDLCGSESLL